MVSTTPGDGDVRSRSWFAVGLVGMVYVIGIAGLWSMVQAFDKKADPTVTPAGDSTTLPPLDESIDVRDAGIDQFFVPNFRPIAPTDTGRDVAASSLREQS